VVSAISPATGPMGGGTSVRITGSNFAAGALVAIGGASATEVVVESATAITAKTAQHAAGAADVAVTVGAQTGRLPGAFMFEFVQNNPPVITSISVLGTKPKEPASFADLNEEVNVMAVVTDEQPIERLTLEWTADMGTFTGTGAAVKWRAPSGVRTPATARLTLTVIEKYTGPNDAGAPVEKEHRVTRTADVSVHDSTKEVGDLAREFLLDFSDSSRSASFVTRNFSRSARCEGERDSEFADVEKNRQHYQITSSFVGSAAVNLQFGGIPCSFRPKAGDACAAVPVSWSSTCLVTFDECVKGDKGTAAGVDFVTAVYEQSQWRLCASDFKGNSTFKGFIR
jgi:hypothetical protein